MVQTPVSQHWHEVLYRCLWFLKDEFYWLKGSPDFLSRGTMVLIFFVFSEITQQLSDGLALKSGSCTLVCWCWSVRLESVGQVLTGTGEVHCKFQSTTEIPISPVDVGNLSFCQTLLNWTVWQTEANFLSSSTFYVNANLATWLITQHWCLYGQTVSFRERIMEQRNGKKRKDRKSDAIMFCYFMSLSHV